MYWTNNTTDEKPMDVNIDADVDEHPFLYLTIKDEDGREHADVTLTTPSDVDYFERQVAEACARFRKMAAESG